MQADSLPSELPGNQSPLSNCRTFLSPLARNPMPFPRFQPPIASNLLSVSTDLPISFNGTIQRVTFSVQFLILGIMFLGFIHGAASGRSLFLFVAE